MAKVTRHAGNGLKHGRATLTFNGTTVGDVGTDVVFTTTGRVRVHMLSAYCTTVLAGATATLQLGTTGDIDAFIAITTATDVAIDEWWTAAVPAAGSKSPLKVETGGLVTSQVDKLVNENIILTVGTAAITSGVVVFDVWYEPITDNGALS